MRIPKTFKVKGKPWMVQWVQDLRDQDGTPCHGLAKYDERTICLDLALKGRSKVNVFLHELFHAALHEQGIQRGDRLTLQREEDLCDLFSALLRTKFTNLKWKQTK